MQMYSVLCRESGWPVDCRTQRLRRVIPPTHQSAHCQRQRVNSSPKNTSPPRQQPAGRHICLNAPQWPCSSVRSALRAAIDTQCSHHVGPAGRLGGPEGGGQRSQHPDLSGRAATAWRRITSRVIKAHTDHPDHKNASLRDIPPTLAGHGSVAACRAGRELVGGSSARLVGRSASEGRRAETGAGSGHVHCRWLYRQQLPSLRSMA